MRTFCIILALRSATFQSIQVRDFVSALTNNIEYIITVFSEVHKNDFCTHGSNKNDKKKRKEVFKPNILSLRKKKKKKRTLQN